MNVQPKEALNFFFNRNKKDMLFIQERKIPNCYSVYDKNLSKSN